MSELNVELARDLLAISQLQYEISAQTPRGPRGPQGLAGVDIEKKLGEMLDKIEEVTRKWAPESWSITVGFWPPTASATFNWEGKQP